MDRGNYSPGDARSRGKEGERRALRLALSLREWCTWIVSVREGTRGEDHDGVDFVVLSDVGPLHVQVKSSPKAAQEFRRKRRRLARFWGLRGPELYAVIVVGERADEEVRDLLFDALHAVREEVLRRRAAHRAP